MTKLGKRTWLAVPIIFLLGFLLSPNALAQNTDSDQNYSSCFTDVGTHWAKGYIEDFADKGLIEVDGSANFRPDDGITRAEFVTLINRAYGFNIKSAQTFTDVNAGSWYYEEISKGVAAGLISGSGDGRMHPDDKISRAEAATVLYRLLRSDKQNGKVTVKDSSEIPSWAESAAYALLSDGTFTGYSDGTFRPQNVLTRAEAVVILSRCTGEYYNKAGTYGPDSGSMSVDGNVTVRADGVTLQNMVIEGKLCLAAGIGDGTVTLENVTVKGKTIVAGGGDHSVVISNSTLGEVVVVRIGGVVRVVAAGDTTIEQVVLETVAALKEEGIIGDGFKDVDIETSALEAGGSVILDGDFDNVTLNAGVNVDITGDTNVKSFYVTGAGGNSTVSVGGSASIDSLVLDGTSHISGTGTVGSIANHSGSTVDTTIHTRPPTSQAGGTSTSDTDPPTVISVSPEDNGTLPADGNLVLNFNETVSAVAGENITIKKVSDDSVFESIPADGAQVTVSGNVVTINPENNFEYTPGYYVLIDSGAFKDTAGNSYTGISDKDAWNFSLPLMISGNATEGAENGKQINVLLNDSYKNQNTIASYVTVENLPEGVEVTDIECQGAFIYIHLYGNSTEDYDSDLTATVHVSGEGLTHGIDESGDFVFPATVESPLFAPTIAISDDVNDTISWTYNAAQNEPGDYEYTTDGGVNWSTCTAKPQTGITGDIAASMVRVRAKATLREPASTVLISYTPYTQTRIESKYPADGQRDIPTNADITIKFYENVTAVHGKKIYIIQCDSTDIGLPVKDMDATDPNVYIDGKTVTIDPDAIFNSGAHYYLYMEPGAFVDSLGRDSEGVGINVIYGKSDTNDYMWDFYTFTQSISYSATAFYESAANDGSVTDTVTATIQNETFTPGPFTQGTNEEDGDYYVSYLPDGLNVTVTPIPGNAHEIVIGLTGNAVNHGAGSYDFYIQFNNSMFTGGMYPQIDGSFERFTVTFVDRFSTIDPENGTFDKANPADIHINMDQNDNVFTGLKNGETALTLNTDYFLSPDDEDTDTVLIRSGYLSSLDNGAANITFCFVGGHNLTLSLSIINTGDHTGPSVAGYDPEPGVTEVAIKDFNVEIMSLTLDENIVLVPEKTITIVDADDAGGSITLTTDNPEVSADGKTLELHVYLEYGTHYYILIEEGAFTDVMGNAFAGISSNDWNFTTEGYVEPAQLDPASAAFDKNELYRDDIDITVTLNEAQALLGLQNGDTVLSEGTDYTVSGSVVTIKQDYLMGLDNGNYAVKFDMQAGNDPVLVITVKETVAPVAVGLSPEDGAKDVATDTTLVITFDKPVVPVSDKDIVIVWYEDINNMYAVETIDAGDDSKVSVQGNAVTISPENELQYNGKYFVIVDQGALKDEAGNEFAGIGYFMWEFETPEKSMTLDGTEFNEASANDGSIGNTITATLTNETFSGKGTYVQGETQNDGDYYVEYLPEGLSVEITDVADNGGTKIQIALSGKATSHSESDTNYSLYIEFHNSMFTGGNRGALTMSDGLYSVEFMDRFSTIEPDTVNYDKATHSDIVIGMNQNENVFMGLKNGQDNLEIGENFTVNPDGDEVTVKNAYLQTLEDGTANITFCFIGGTDPMLTVNITDSDDVTGPVMQSCTPEPGSEHVDTSMGMWFSITFDETIVKSDEPEIKIVKTLDGTFRTVNNMFLNVSGKTASFFVAGLDNSAGYYITINEYAFADVAGNNFSGIDDANTWSFTTERYIEPARLTPSSVNYDKNLLYSHDIDVAMTLDGGQSLAGLKNGDSPLELNTDYIIDGNTVTIMETYLLGLNTGTNYITFDMDVGNDPQLQVTVKATDGDQMPPEVTGLSPADGETGITLDKGLVLTFDEPVFPGEGELEPDEMRGIYLSLLKADGSIWSTTQLDTDGDRVSFSGNTVTVDLRSLLGYNSHYAVFVGQKTIQDEAGNPFPGVSYNDYENNDYMWDFYTVEKSINWSGTEFSEADANDGSIENTINVTLHNMTFSGQGTYVKGTDADNGDYYIDGDLPDGLTLQVKDVPESSGTQVEISLTGKAPANDHDDSCEFAIHLNKAMLPDADYNMFPNTTETLSVGFHDAPPVISGRQRRPRRLRYRRRDRADDHGRRVRLYGRVQQYVQRKNVVVRP